MTRCLDKNYADSIYKNMFLDAFIYLTLPNVNQLDKNKACVEFNKQSQEKSTA